MFSFSFFWFRFRTHFSCSINFVSTVIHIFRWSYEKSSLSLNKNISIMMFLKTQCIIFSFFKISSIFICRFWMLVGHTDLKVRWSRSILFSFNLNLISCDVMRRVLSLLLSCIITTIIALFVIYSFAGRCYSILTVIALKQFFQIIILSNPIKIGMF